MEHKTCLENLSAYLDGELPREEKLLLEAHLAGCPDCGKALAELKSLSLIIHKHAMEPVPVSLKNKVFAEKREKPAYYAWLKPALATSMAAACVLIFLNTEENPKPESAQLPALPKHAGSGPVSGVSAGSSLDMFKDTMSAAAPSGAGGGGVRAPQAAMRAGAFGQAKAARANYAGAASGESAAEQGSPPVLALAGASEEARRPRSEAALDSKAGYKGITFASGKAAAQAGAAGLAAEQRTRPVSASDVASEEAMRMESERTAGLEARNKRMAPVRKKTVASVGAYSISSTARQGPAIASVTDYIVENYATDNGGRLSSKVFNRFKSSAFRSVPVKDAGIKEIWKSDRYGTFISYDLKGPDKKDVGGPAERSFAFVDLNKREIQCPSTGIKDLSGAELNKRLWDIFEYDSKTYLLLVAEFHGRHTIEYFLLESGKLRSQGAINHFGE